MNDLNHIHHTKDLNHIHTNLHTVAYIPFGRLHAKIQVFRPIFYDVMGGGWGEASIPYPHSVLEEEKGLCQKAIQADVVN